MPVAPRRRAVTSRRRTELGLLILGGMVVGFAYVLASLGKTASIPANVGPFLGVIFGLALVAHLANRWLVPDATPVILPIAALLNGIGYVIIARLNFNLAGLQACALDRLGDDVAAHGGAVRVVEGAAVGPADRRARGRDDNGVCHSVSLW